MKVQVILPTYRPKKWVEEAIESVIAQSYDNWILTIIDDAFPDNSITRIKNFLERKLVKEQRDRIDLIELPNNIGAAGARNRAAKYINSDAICFIDQDDKYHPKKIETQVKELKKQEIELVHSNIIQIDAEGHFLEEGGGNEYRNSLCYQDLRPLELQKELFRVNSLRIGSVMIRRDAFDTAGGFDESLFGGEEWEFWVRFADKYRFKHVKDNLYLKRMHPGQVSSTYKKDRRYGQLEAIKKMINNFPQLSSLATSKRQGIVRAIVKSEILSSNYRQAEKLIDNELPELDMNIKDRILFFLPRLGDFGKWILLAKRIF